MGINKEIETVSAFQVNGMLFHTKEAAEEYVYESLDDVQLGDHVSLPGGFNTIFGSYGLEGTVSCIEGDLIWFVLGDCPMEVIKWNRIKYNSNHFEHKGVIYKWKVARRKRSQLKRKYLPLLNINLR